MRCERCGEPGPTITIETKDGAQQAELCAECVEIVVRPNTNYQVSDSKEAGP